MNWWLNTKFLFWNSYLDHADVKVMSYYRTLPYHCRMNILAEVRRWHTLLQALRVFQIPFAFFFYDRSNSPPVPQDLIIPTSNFTLVQPIFLRLLITWTCWKLMRSSSDSWFRSNSMDGSMFMFVLEIKKYGKKYEKFGLKHLSFLSIFYIK